MSFFCLIASVASFFFFIITENGHIRGFGLIGEGIGFATVRLTLSKLIYPLLCRIFGAVIGFYKRIITLLSLVFDYIYKIFNILYVFVKKLLQVTCRLMYNTEENKENGEERNVQGG